MPMALVMRTNVDFQIEIAPADGIRLPMGKAETSVGRRFWAALSQDNLLDRGSTYHPRAVTPSEIAPVAGEGLSRTFFCSA
jgi:hypothetical protein